MRTLIIVALVGLLAPAYAQPAKLSPVEIAAKVEATYKDAASVTATFSKTQVNATFGTTTISNGTVAFQRPGKMAWEFIDKKKNKDNEFVYDGKTGWIVRHKNKTFVEQPMSATDLPAVIAFLAGSGSLSKDFTIAAPKQEDLVPGGVVIQLAPKAPSASFTRVVLVIDPTAWTVTRSIVFVPGGDKTTYEFSNVDTKAKLDAKRFVFDATKYPLYTPEKPPAAAKPPVAAKKKS